MLVPFASNYNGKYCTMIRSFILRVEVGRIVGGYHRLGATRDNLFNNDRKGCLDKIIFSNIGLKWERIQARYYLIFNQILSPMCYMGRSGIRGDPINYYY